MLRGSESVGLSDLLDQNITCYEYFHGLPLDIQRRLENRDITSFDEMQNTVAELRAESGEERDAIAGDLVGTLAFEEEKLDRNGEYIS